MMGDNLPSWNLPAQVTPRPTLPGKTDADGAVGVGTWVTQAEYKDVKITAANGNVQHPALKDLVKQSEGWTITDSLAKQQSDASMAAAVFNTPVTGDYTLELKARKTGGNEGFLVLFGITDDNKKGYLVNIGGWGNTLTAIERVANGTTAGVLSKQVPGHVETNQWYNIRIVKTDWDISVYLNDSLQIKYAPANQLRQFAVSGYDEKSGELIVKVVNAEEQPWRAAIDIVTTGKIAAEGKVITLSAGGLQDENSYETPLKIIPKKSVYGQFANSFEYNFKPASFTILRLKMVK
jgi:alpha-L-arabinofuranosidase